jgi:tyrosine-protein phosphatase YwqE
MVHFLATDAHNTKRRPPKAKRAIAALQTIAGERVTKALTEDNPKAVIENRPLPFEPDPLPAAEPGFFNRVKELFSKQ